MCETYMIVVKFSCAPHARPGRPLSKYSSIPAGKSYSATIIELNSAAGYR